jgi:hypothetical protein
MVLRTSSILHYAYFACIVTYSIVLCLTLNFYLKREKEKCMCTELCFHALNIRKNFFFLKMFNSTLKIVSNKDGISHRVIISGAYVCSGDESTSLSSCFLKQIGGGRGTAQNYIHLTCSVRSRKDKINFA